jgi:hypothetical protein
MTLPEEYKSAVIYILYFTAFVTFRKFYIFTLSFKFFFYKQTRDDVRLARNT